MENELVNIKIVDLEENIYKLINDSKLPSMIIKLLIDNISNKVNIQTTYSLMQERNSQNSEQLIE